MGLNQSSIVIVLVRPQLPENIGAAARVMKNFGFNHLRLVCPLCEPTHDQAIAMSAGADDILENAQVFDSLDHAVHDQNFVYATGANQRDISKPVMMLPEGVEKMFQPFGAAQSSDQEVSIAIVFGPERTGLTKDDLIFSNAVWTIPTQKDFSSLNLAQAIGIVLYEITSGKIPASQQKDNEKVKKSGDEPAKTQDLNYFLQDLEERLDMVNYWRNLSQKPTMKRNLFNIFTKQCFTTQDLKTLRGVIRALNEWKRLK